MTSSATEASSTQPPTAAIAARTYDIDSIHSSATFKVRHLMVANVRGELGRVSGRVRFNEVDVTQSSVEAAIDARTVNTRDETRDIHLRSAEFFDVAHFPTIVFKSTRVSASTGHGLLVAGDLTLRGITREITLDVDAVSLETTDNRGNIKRGLSARTHINRKDFGVSWNATLDSGGVLVGDEVSIKLEIELAYDPSA